MDLVRDRVQDYLARGIERLGAPVSLRDRVITFTSLSSATARACFETLVKAAYRRSAGRDDDILTFARVGMTTTGSVTSSPQSLVHCGI
jgi:hypothetical protein